MGIVKMNIERTAEWYLIKKEFIDDDTEGIKTTVRHKSITN